MNKPLRILVLEDQLSDFLLLERQLRRQLGDVECQRVAALDELQTALADGGWDVVLSDYNMPALPFEQGVTAVREQLPTVPVILVSGSIGEEQAIELLHRGVADFVLKDRHARLGPAILRALQEAQQEAARRAAEEALRISQARYRLLFEAPHDAIFVVSTAAGGGPGRFTEVNDRACRSLGYTREELLQLGPLDVSETLQTEAGFQEMARLLATGGGVVDDHHLAKDGRRFPVEVSMSPLKLGDEELALCVARDVSDRLAAEDALRESEARYRALFNAAHDAVFLIRHRPDGRPDTIAEINDVACRQLGYSREELIGQPPSLFVVHGDEADFATARDKLDQGGGIFPSMHRAKDGTTFPVEVSISPVEVDEEPMALCVTRDVSERVAAEQERQELEQQLRQAQRLEAVGRLAGGVAHDFNNMLSVILGYSEAALANLAPEEELHGDLQDIAEAARRSADLTRQLLAFSRKQVIEPQSLDLSRAIEGMGKLLKRLIGEDIELQIETDSRLWQVFLDPTQVDQVLANLAVNSRDAMPDGGRLLIRIQNQSLAEPRPGLAPGEYVVIEVADSGCGMTEETRDHLFEPFYTTKAEGVGTGLGLSTVYGIVQQNGGQIEVDSTLGAGTTMRLYFPRHHGAARAETRAAVQQATSGNGEAVLLVEDEAPVRKLGVAMLTRLGYEVSEASSYQDALDQILQAEHPIDLVLTDLVMPGFNGRELADAIHRLRPELPVLFMSGYSAEIIADRNALHQGGKFLQKPFSNDQLGRFIRTGLEQSKGG